MRIFPYFALPFSRFQTQISLIRGKIGTFSRPKSSCRGSGDTHRLQNNRSGRQVFASWLSGSSISSAENRRRAMVVRSLRYAGEFSRIPQRRKIKDCVRHHTNVPADDSEQTAVRCSAESHCMFGSRNATRGDAP